MKTPHPFRWLNEHRHLTLQYVDCGPSTAGLYWSDLDVIQIHDRLGQAERRSTLAHERAHVLLGHTACVDRFAAVEQERDAEIHAARYLIEMWQLGPALAWVIARDPSDRASLEHELAEELWVDVPLMRTRLAHLHPAERQYLARIGWGRDEGVA